MTQEEKQLLLKDLCARLPYGLFCQTDDGKGKLISVECSFGDDLVYVDFGYPEAKEYDLNEGDSVKPYLRPMSSMTEEEKDNLQSLHDIISNENYGDGYSPSAWNAITEWEDYCNARHLDYRGLIERGLVLEAPEGMYENN